MDDLLQQGIAALKAGRKSEARDLLMQVIQQDEHNEMAWLWLSGAVDMDRERRTCLENVLAINPNNGAARRGLESLIAKEGVHPLEAVPQEWPVQPPAASTPNLTASQKHKPLPKRKRTARRRTRLTMGLGVAVILVSALVAIAGVWWAIDAGWLQLGSGAPVAAAITQVPSIRAISTAIPQPTQIPTWTPLPGSTNILATAPTSDVPILADPLVFVLTLAEMPPGFRIVPENTGPRNNESVAEQRESPEEFLAQLEAWGRISGYEAAYEGSGSGVSYVSASAVIMSTSDGAHAYFEYLASEEAQGGGIPVSMPTLADESYALTYTETDQDGYQWTDYQITFRKRNVIAGVFTAASRHRKSQPPCRLGSFTERTAWSRLSPTGDWLNSMSPSNSIIPQSVNPPTAQAPQRTDYRVLPRPAAMAPPPITSTSAPTTSQGRGGSHIRGIGLNLR